MGLLKRGVVPFMEEKLPVMNPHDHGGRVVEKVAIVRYNDQGNILHGRGLQVSLQPQNGLPVKVIRGFVQHQDIWLGKQGTRNGDAHAPTATEHLRRRLEIRRLEAEPLQQHHDLRLHGCWIQQRQTSSHLCQLRRGFEAGTSVSLCCCLGSSKRLLRLLHLRLSFEESLASLLPSQPTQLAFVPRCPLTLSATAQELQRAEGLRRSLWVLRGLRWGQRSLLGLQSGELLVGCQHRRHSTPLVADVLLSHEEAAAVLWKAWDPPLVHCAQERRFAAPISADQPVALPGAKLQVRLNQQLPTSN
mmetsp:Transcript_69537/g.166728  ORF Transcript_69537/g.166728 Transcript_69537/m.166728 type:complete len:303 (+) Transcript_69537:1350-2258(+)